MSSFFPDLLLKVASFGFTSKLHPDAHLTSRTGNKHNIRFVKSKQTHHNNQVICLCNNLTQLLANRLPSAECSATCLLTLIPSGVRIISSSSSRLCLCFMIFTSLSAVNRAQCRISKIIRSVSGLRLLLSLQ